MDKNRNRKIAGKLFSSKVNLQIKKIQIKGTICIQLQYEVKMRIWEKDILILLMELSVVAYTQKLLPSEAVVIAITLYFLLLWKREILSQNVYIILFYYSSISSTSR